MLLFHTRKSRKKGNAKKYLGNFNKTLTLGKKPQKNPLKKGGIEFTLAGIEFTFKGIEFTPIEFILSSYHLWCNNYKP